MDERDRGEGSNSSLFLLRLWLQGGGDSQGEWSGRVIHITSGRASNFLNLPALSELLLAMLDERREEEGGEAGGKATGHEREDTKQGDNDDERASLYHFWHR